MSNVGSQLIIIREKLMLIIVCTTGIKGEKRPLLYSRSVLTKKHEVSL